MDKAPEIDRQALAEQVIVSAGNILFSAGFDREEIGDFFRQAANQLCAEPSLQPSDASALSAPASESDPVAKRDDLARIFVSFSENAAVRELHGVAERACALLPLEKEPSRPRDAFDLAMQMAPLLAEAQQALRRLANEARLPLFANRAEWRKHVETGELAQATPVVCLEDFETAYEAAYEAIGAVVRHLAKRQDQEAFITLLGQLADNGVIISPQLQVTIENGLSQLALQ